MAVHVSDCKSSKHYAEYSSDLLAVRSVKVKSDRIQSGGTFG